MPRRARAIWLHGASADDLTISAIVGRAINALSARAAARSLLAQFRGSHRGNVAAALIAELDGDCERALQAVQLSDWWHLPCGHQVTDWDGEKCGWGCGDEPA